MKAVGLFFAAATVVWFAVYAVAVRRANREYNASLDAELHQLLEAEASS